MTAVAEAIVGRLLVREGGVTNDPVDRGGATRWGQTVPWLAEYHLPTPQDATQAAANYLLWLSITKLDALCEVDDKLADVTIDLAVHVGTGRAIRALQAAIGARPDGVIGSQTIAAIANCDRGAAAAKVWGDHVIAWVQTVLGDPMLKPLIETTQLRFLRGWANRSIGQVTRL